MKVIIRPKLGKANCRCVISRLTLHCARQRETSFGNIQDQNRQRRNMASENLDEDIERAAKAVKQANCIIITAGAGMGVDSGLPDFRGPEGLWKAYPPLQKRGLTLPETSNPRWFDNDPKFAWGFFGHRYNLYKQTVPHRGFQILRKWAEAKPDGYFVFTSNVDGHFQKAGFDGEKVEECHGSIHFLQCVDASHSSKIWPVPEDFRIDIDDTTLEARNKLPTGPPDLPLDKQHLARPNILMFGDWGFVDDRANNQSGNFTNFKYTSVRSTEKFVVVEIGAGLAVPTVRFTSEQLVEDFKHGTLIRINPRDPDIPDKRHISLPIGGLEALDKIDKIIQTKITQ